MNKDIESVLITEKDLAEINARLGKEISEDYLGKEVVVVGMLKGVLPFMMDLIRNITIPIKIDFMQPNSYHGGTTSQEMILRKDIDLDIENKHVLLVDDIVDTGKTMKLICDMIGKRNPASVEVVTLLDKPEGRLVELTPKYVGTLVPNAFVVGYGLDFDEYYRNMPYIGILKPEKYQ